VNSAQRTEQLQGERSLGERDRHQHVGVSSTRRPPTLAKLLEAAMTALTSLDQAGYVSRR
jgi:hypothetical protein